MVNMHLNCGDQPIQNMHIENDRKHNVLFTFRVSGFASKKVNFKANRKTKICEEMKEETKMKLGLKQEKKTARN